MAFKHNVYKHVILFRKFYPNKEKKSKSNKRKIPKEQTVKSRKIINSSKNDQTP
jgi:hypothetical protein